MCSYHLDINIDSAISALLALFIRVTGMTPKYAAHGGSARESLALQNIQVCIKKKIIVMFTN